MSQRKHNSKKSDSNATPTKVAHSPSRNQAYRSPLTASKLNIASNSKPAVSYGELQIVLANIHQIRKKASYQINQLTQENEKLKEELFKSQQEFNGLTISRVSRHDYQSKLIEQLEILESNKRQLQQQLKGKNQIQAALHLKNNQLMKRLEDQLKNKQQLQMEIEEWKKKWDWAFSILAGDQNRSDQLIWKVKTDCQQGIWGLFDKNSTLGKQLQHEISKLEIVEREFNQFKNDYRKTTDLLEKSMTEVSQLNLKIAHGEEQALVQKEKYIKSHQQSEKIINGLREKIVELQNIINPLQQKIYNFENEKDMQFSNLVKKVSSLEEELNQKCFQLSKIQKKQKYQALISQICQQGQDYSQMLQRLRYLQKFKLEHYFNVQKIQFLCKMLDY